MKLLLLTLCPQMNYGGVLQAYATQEKLRQLGHEVLLFDGLAWAPPDSYYLCRRPVPWRWKALSLLRRGFHTGKELLWKRGKRTADFLKNHFSLSPVNFGNWKNFPFGELGLDALVVGSDQVWNCWRGTTGAFRTFLLEDGPALPALAYASSIGMKEIPDAVKHFYREGWGRFSAISVREEEGANLVRSLGFSATHVVDPTLLLSPEEWKHSLSLPEEKKEQLFCYFMEDKIHEVLPLLEEYARKTGKDVHLFFNNENLQHSHLPTSLAKCLHWMRYQKDTLLKSPKIHFHVDAGPGEFLQCLAESSQVVSDSFHALMFSYLFRANVRILKPANAFRQGMFARIQEFSQLVSQGTLLADNLGAALDSLHQDPPLLFQREKIQTRIQDSLAWLKTALASLPLRKPPADSKDSLSPEGERALDGLK